MVHGESLSIGFTPPPETQKPRNRHHHLHLPVGEVDPTSSAEVIGGEHEARLAAERTVVDLQRWATVERSGGNGNVLKMYRKVLLLYVFDENFTGFW